MLAFLTSHFSYGVLFVWSLFEGEIGLAIAGFLSHKNQLELPLVIAIAFSGAIISDVIVYLIGRRHKTLAHKLLKHHTASLKKIEQWLQRYGSWVIVFDRFMYGTHIPAMLMIGVARYPFKKFIFLEIIGVLLWSMTFTSLGYLFGEEVFTLIQLTQKNLLLLFIFVMLVMLLYVNHRK